MDGVDDIDKINMIGYRIQFSIMNLWYIVCSAQNRPPPPHPSTIIYFFK